MPIYDQLQLSNELRFITRCKHQRDTNLKSVIKRNKKLYFNHQDCYYNTQYHIHDNNDDKKNDILEFVTDHDF